MYIYDSKQISPKFKNKKRVIIQESVESIINKIEIPYNNLTFEEISTIDMKLSCEEITNHLKQSTMELFIQTFSLIEMKQYTNLYANSQNCFQVVFNGKVGKQKDGKLIRYVDHIGTESLVTEQNNEYQQICEVDTKLQITQCIYQKILVYNQTQQLKSKILEQIKIIKIVKNQPKLRVGDTQLSDFLNRIEFYEQERGEDICSTYSPAKLQMIGKGEVMIFKNDFEQILNEGCHFGDYSVLEWISTQVHSREPIEGFMSGRAKSKTNVHVLTLNKEDFKHFFSNCHFFKNTHQQGSI